jgi:hypothetical protein
MPGQTYKRVMLEIDSIKFYPMEVKYAVSRAANNVGRRVGESLAAKAFVWVDAAHVDNLSAANQIELWKMAVEAKDPGHHVSITYYLDDVDKVLSNIEFNGWVSVFQYSNPKVSMSSVAGGTMGDAAAVATASASFTNLLYLELTTMLDEPNVSKHKFTK